MSFNPDEFLAASISTSNDTKIIPVPVGEYAGMIEKVLPRQWQSKDGTQTGISLDIIWSVEDSNVKQHLNREHVTVKQGIMLDTTDSGALDVAKGKNIGLGRLREAVGKNSEGEPFSFAMLPGLMAKIAVTHRVVGEETYAEVKMVAKL